MPLFFRDFSDLTGRKGEAGSGEFPGHLVGALKSPRPEPRVEWWVRVGDAALGGKPSRMLLSALPRRRSLSACSCRLLRGAPQSRP